MKPILAFYGIPDRYPGERPAYVHDHNLTVWCDGRVQTHLHLERLTRRKMDNRLPEYLESVLDDLGLKEFDLVSVNSFVGDHLTSQGGRLRIRPDGNMQIDNLNPATAWFQSEKWAGHAPTAAVVSHELAHIYSCVPFFGPFREKSLLVHFDGGASVGNFSAWHYRNGRAHLLEVHWELNHLSKLFNDNALSFALMKARPGDHGSVPGKLMGYAAMETSSGKMEQWLIRHDYFRNIWDDHKPFYRAALRDWNWNGHLSEINDPFLMQVAAGLQSIFQQEILEKLYTLQRQTGSKYLYYTGGCALNICTNQKLVQSGRFERVFIPPCCNDSGLSLGAAALLAQSKSDSIHPHSPYLNNYQLSPIPTQFDAATIQKTAEIIAISGVIGVCNGPGEVGPRALGNRSLLARADSRSLSQHVSQVCKQREWFRPVAPVMLRRNAELFVGGPVDRLTDYMLLDYPILPQYTAELEGVVHQNGTARIQTLSDRSQNPFLYDLLEYLEQQCGIRGLINTSFNRRGEPIVHTTDDARTAAVAMKLNGLILNGQLWTGNQFTSTRTHIPSTTKTNPSSAGASSMR